MLSSAKRNLQRFFETYFHYYDKPTILEIGSLCLGNQWNMKKLRNEMNVDFKYIGVDMKEGNNVNIVNIIVGNAEASPSQLISGDLNNDGLIDVLDLVQLLNTILNS